MLQNLNDRFYSLFSDLYANRSVLPPKQYDIMVAALNSEYKRELEMIVGDIQLQTARDVFEQRFKLTLFVPHKFLFWMNKVAKAYIKDCKQQFQEFLQDLKNARTVAADEIPGAQPQTAVVPKDTEIILQEE